MYPLLSLLVLLAGSNLELILVDPCEGNPCENGGTCNGTLGQHEYTCNCTTAWEGGNCTTRVDPCTYRNPCVHGNCSTDALKNETYCHCELEWEGDICDTQLVVDTCAVIHPCQNNGTCRSMRNSQYFCNCTEWWTGKNCIFPITTTSNATPMTTEYTCQNNTCLHEGYCVNSQNCTCISPYEGKNCETVLVQDHCEIANPCLNNGTCTTLQYGYNCTCTDKWEGYNCSIPITTTTSTTTTTTTTPSCVCYNYGTCTTSGNTWSCLCPDGFEGDQCQTASVYDLCQISMPCMNNGTCTSGRNYTCNCTEMWTGMNCTIPVTTTSTTTTTTTTPAACHPNPCLNGGNCTGDNVCVCPDNWSGTICQTTTIIDHCKVSNPCMNNGTCYTVQEGPKCNCTGAWEGNNCTYTTTSTTTTTTTTTTTEPEDIITVCANDTTTTTSTTSTTTTPTTSTTSTSTTSSTSTSTTSSTSTSTTSTTSTSTTKPTSTSISTTTPSSTTAEQNTTTTETTREQTTTAIETTIEQTTTRERTTTTTDTITDSTFEQTTPRERTTSTTDKITDSTTEQSTTSSASKAITTPIEKEEDTMLAALHLVTTFNRNEGNSVPEVSHFSVTTNKDDRNTTSEIVHSNTTSTLEEIGSIESSRATPSMTGSHSTDYIDEYMNTTGDVTKYPSLTTGTTTKPITTVSSHLRLDTANKSTNTTGLTEKSTTTALDCNNSPCQNGGVCTSGSCLCQPGFSGLLCADLDVFDYCASGPCQNNGTCDIATNYTGFVCLCIHPYTGLHCNETLTTTTTTTTQSLSTITNTTEAPTTSATTTTPSQTVCSPFGIDYAFTDMQKTTNISGALAAGDTAEHHCLSGSSFSDGSVMQTYTCSSGGNWTGGAGSCQGCDTGKNLSCADGSCSCLTPPDLPNVWLDAEDNCQGMGSHLPLIPSAGAWSSFQAYRKGNATWDKVWIGLRFISGSYVWADGEAFDPSADTHYFGSNLPMTSPVPEDFCVVSIQSNDGGWEAASCTESGIYGICYSAPVAPPAGTVSPPDAWESAKTACTTQQNKPLPIPKTAYEWDDFEAHVGQVESFDHIWIGLRYDLTAGEMVWADGSTFQDSDYVPWDTGEPGNPTNRGDRHCAYRSKDNGFKIKFAGCSEIKPILCYEMPKYCPHPGVKYEETENATSFAKHATYGDFSRDRSHYPVGTLIHHRCIASPQATFHDNYPARNYQCLPDQQFSGVDGECRYVCPPPIVDYSYTTATTNGSTLTENQLSGTVIHHECLPEGMFGEGNTVKDYECKPGNIWTNLGGSCVACPTGQTISCADNACTCSITPPAADQWSPAKEFCQNAGSDLPIIKSDAEWNQYLIERKANLTGKKTWLGLKYSVAGGSWVWSDMSPFDDAVFNQWAPGLPYLSFTQDTCAFSDPAQDFKWSHTECTAADITGLCFSPAPETPKTPPGSLSSPTAWESARDDCNISYGSNIPMPKTEIQWKYFQSIRTMSSAYDNIWIGLRYLSASDSFEWADRAPYSPSLTWAWAVNGEDTGDDSKDLCAYSEKNGTEYLWKLGDCNDNRTPLCYDIPKLCGKTGLTYVNHKVAFSNAPSVNYPVPVGSVVRHTCLDGFAFADGLTTRDYVCNTTQLWSNLNGECNEVTTSTTTSTTTTTTTSTTTSTTTTTVEPTTTEEPTTTTPPTTLSPTPPPPPSCPKPVFQREDMSNVDRNNPGVHESTATYPVGHVLAHKCKYGSVFSNWEEPLEERKYICQSNGEWKDLDDQEYCMIKTVQCPAEFIEVDGKCVSKPKGALADPVDFDVGANTCDMIAPAPPEDPTSNATYNATGSRSFILENMDAWMALKSEMEVRNQRNIEAGLGELHFWVGLRYFDVAPPAKLGWPPYGEEPSWDYSSLWKTAPTADQKSHINCVYADPTDDYKWKIKACDDPSIIICQSGNTVEKYTTTTSTTTTSTTVTTTSAAPTTTEITTTEEPTTTGPVITTTLVPPLLGINWAAAMDQCNTFPYNDSSKGGGPLAQPRTQWEWDSFLNITRGNALIPNDLWIGLLWNSTEEEWKWADGSDFSISDLPDVWATDEPKIDPNATDDRCVYVDLSVARWKTDSCTALRNAICYLNPVEPTSTTTTTLVPETDAPPKGPLGDERLPPNIMTEMERLASVVVQSMGCTFIIGALAAVIGLYLLFRSFDHDSQIVLCQDVAILIAHLFVLTLREPALFPSTMKTNSGVEGVTLLTNTGKGICTLAAVCMHYFFLAGYTFMLLESLQMMVIVGNVMPKGHLFGWVTNLAIGWGAPGVVVALCAISYSDEYTNIWTCWGDLESTYIWGLALPLSIICAITMINVEAAGMMSRDGGRFADVDKTQLTTGLVSRGSLPIVMFLTLGSHIVGIAAVYSQIVYLYGACFIMNILNGIATFTFHTAIHPQIRLFVKNLFLKIKGLFGCGKG